MEENESRLPIARGGESRLWRRAMPVEESRSGGGVMTPVEEESRLSTSMEESSWLATLTPWRNGGTSFFFLAWLGWFVSDENKSDS